MVLTEEVETSMMRIRLVGRKMKVSVALKVLDLNSCLLVMTSKISEYFQSKRSLLIEVIAKSEETLESASVDGYSISRLCSSSLRLYMASQDHSVTNGQFSM